MPFLLTRRQVYAKVRTGAEINLLSVYIAHPTPDVRWFKNGLLLQESKKRPRMKLFVKKQNFPAHQAELSILDSTLSDFGIYQCVVYNRFGSFDVTFFVAIYEPGKSRIMFTMLLYDCFFFQNVALVNNNRPRLSP